MSKTALQMAIEELQQSIDNCLAAIKNPETPNKEHYVSKKAGLSQALSIISACLPTERKQIEQAFDKGFEEYMTYEDGYDYFTKTYEQ